MEDLDHAIAAARKYGYKYRIVTLDGQVLNPGGSMTGGSASRSAGILSRANELERLNEQGRGLREQLAQAAKALEEADREAAAAGEVPVGCVIVDRAGQIIGRGRNRREEDKSPLAHAELAAITDACRSHGDWRLKGARLYVTLEPCPMCAGGILSARIPELYYGAKDAGFGACGSILNLFEEDFRHHPKIVGHILEEECAQLLQDFFAQVRKKSPENLKIL